MFKKILLGSSAYQYLPLARRLWNKMPEGKKSYRFPGVYIDLAKGITNYIRIKAEPVERKAVAIFAFYWFPFQQCDYTLEFWCVDLKGNLTILILKDDFVMKISRRPYSALRCGRFNLDNPAEFYLIIEEEPEYSRPVFVEGNGYTCAIEEIGSSYRYVFKIIVDFCQKRTEVTQILKEQNYKYHSYENYYDVCQSNWREANYWDSGYGALSYTADDTYDLYVTNNVFSRLYLYEEYQHSFRPCEWKGSIFNFPEGQTCSNRRTEICLRKIILEGGSSLLLESTNRTAHSRALFTGTHTQFDTIWKEPRNILLKVAYPALHILDDSSFVYICHQPDDAKHVQVVSTKHGVWAELEVPYLPRIKASRGGNHPFYPSFTLLRKNGFSYTLDARFIEQYSYAYYSFVSFTFYKVSLMSSLKDSSSCFKTENAWVVGFPNPLKEYKEYFGAWFSDAPDFGYGGLGWSNPILWDGFFVLPFCRWTEIKTWEDIIPQKIKIDRVNAVPNHFFQNLIMVPTQAFNGTYINDTSWADADAFYMLDLVLIQKKDRDYYVNGNKLETKWDSSRIKF